MDERPLQAERGPCPARGPSRQGLFHGNPSGKSEDGTAAGAARGRPHAERRVETLRSVFFSAGRASTPDRSAWMNAP
ncbi:MAG: hypothetical protein VB089_15315, partial [Anaerolineaceae bacterium]|nr:hypothetical protein [Anaerolineaceae bacterium]